MSALPLFLAAAFAVGYATGSIHTHHAWHRRYGHDASPWKPKREDRP